MAEDVGDAQAVTVGGGDPSLPGWLAAPRPGSGMVIFAHGSGSSRHSTRNRYVASTLNRAGLGTMLFDLLTSQEAADRATVFDVGLLAGRLRRATAWLREQPWSAGVPVGWFGASTGAAAALAAAGDPAAEVAAIVCRSGRPDLAGGQLAAVHAPTLLIVGGNDAPVLELNRTALAELRCHKQLAVVPGATHLFEEPGTLAAVAELARDWFSRHLRAPAGTGARGGRPTR